MRPILLALALLSATPALAQQPADPATAENGRYSMTPVQDGFLRLDTRTGAVAMCRLVNGAPECRLAADERAALENEIGRLQAENKELHLKPPGPSAAAPPSSSLSEHDMDKALSFAERFMRRMMRIMREQGDGPDKTAFSPHSAAPH
ncbi:MAG: hypothetical protein QOG66_666 [Methylobacteriaceae bacterium]|nr:hypothetical protein [Methylobacteriaceae bacterium]